MSHPHQLHATAALWSLRAARDLLTDLARAENRRNTTSLLDAAPVSSPTYGTRHQIGGHGDPVSATLLADPVRETTWAELLDRLNSRLRWLADQIRATPDPALSPLARIFATIPHLLPGTARIVAQHLNDEDTWVRDTIGQPRPTQPLPGVACPACGRRRLHVQTAGPETGWTVVCDCRCAGVAETGQGCPCGMPGAVEGVAHIWPRAVVLGAVAGAAPTTKTAA